MEDPQEDHSPYHLIHIKFSEIPETLGRPCSRRIERHRSSSQLSALRLHQPRRGDAPSSPTESYDECHWARRVSGHHALQARNTSEIPTRCCPDRCSVRVLNAYYVQPFQIYRPPSLHCISLPFCRSHACSCSATSPPLHTGIRRSSPSGFEWNRHYVLSYAGSIDYPTPPSSMGDLQPISAETPVHFGIV